MALISAAIPVRSPAGRGLASLGYVLTGLLSITAFGTALYQHFVAAIPGNCKITLVDRWLSASGLSDWMPSVFAPMAFCDEADAPLLGIPYSLWSATLATLLTIAVILALMMLWRRRS